MRIEKLPWQTQLVSALALVALGLFLHHLFGFTPGHSGYENQDLSTILYMIAFMLFILSIIGMLKAGIDKLRNRKNKNKLTS